MIIIAMQLKRRPSSWIGLFQLDTNKLYATTVHNIVNNQLQMDEKTALTNAKAKKATFRFEDVKGLLANIKDPELAIAATQWVAKLLPVGMLLFLVSKRLFSFKVAIHDQSISRCL